jgi:hypothetical protein
MAVIATLIEPRRVTRVLFDCSDAAPDPADQRCIEQAIQRSNAMSQGRRVELPNKINGFS